MLHYLAIIRCWSFLFSKSFSAKGKKVKKKITQYTRYGTVFLAAAQAYGVSYFLETIRGPASGLAAVPDPGLGFTLETIITITTGTIFIMWLGEQITERGIGNGISLIIFIGIIAELPNAIRYEYQHYLNNINLNKGLIQEIFLSRTLMFLIVAFCILTTLWHTQDPGAVCQARGGTQGVWWSDDTYSVENKLANVIPIIFAQSIMFLPGTITQLFPDSEFLQGIGGLFSTVESLVYWTIYGLMIIFFTYFYTAIVMDPNSIADNMKKHGGFIPGIRPGPHCSIY